MSIWDGSDYKKDVNNLNIDVYKIEREEWIFKKNIASNVSKDINNKSYFWILPANYSTYIGDEFRIVLSDTLRPDIADTAIFNSKVPFIKRKIKGF